MFFWKVRGADGSGVPDELGYVARIISIVKVEINWAKAILLRGAS